MAAPPNRNLHKKFLTVPRSLPSKLVMDVQRERWQVTMGGSLDTAVSEEEEEDGEQGVDSAEERSKVAEQHLRVVPISDTASQIICE